MEKEGAKWSWRNSQISTSSAVQSKGIILEKLNFDNPRTLNVVFSSIPCVLDLFYNSFYQFDIVKMLIFGLLSKIEYWEAILILNSVKYSFQPCEVHRAMGLSSSNNFLTVPCSST
ncbi:hypothetical protein B566_EDAN015050 [Ephemera danica]|nr:hypothetical protein B566_EDAN015050 [Ephemera danica]